MSKRLKVEGVRSEVKIGLMGPFGFGNLGDAAIQHAMIQQIRRSYPQAQIFGFSLNPEDTERRHGISSFPIGRMAKNGWMGSQTGSGFRGAFQRTVYNLRSSGNPLLRLFSRIFLSLPLEVLSILEASRILKGFELFIVSGGGQLDDYWGGAWHHPYSLLLWSLLAKFRRVKLMFVSVGAGPLGSALSRRFVHWALSLASYRSFRDQQSREFIEMIGFRGSGLVYPDLAFSLDIDWALNAVRRPSARRVVGIGPMIYFDPRAWPERDQSIYLAYLNKLASFVSWLLQKQYAVAFFTGDAYYDRAVIEDLKEILKDRGQRWSEDQVIEAPILTVDDLLEQIAGMDFVVASRFHGVLLSLLMNKPVIALSYHEKIDVLMAESGQAAYCLPIDSFSAEALIERFQKMEADCERIKCQLSQKIQEYRAALDEQYERIFQNL